MTAAAPTRSFADHRLPLLLLLATLVFWAGFMGLVLRDAALPDNSAGTVVVVFPFGRTPGENFTSLLAAEGRLVQNTWFDNIWVVHSDQAGFVGRLKSAGAWSAFSHVPFESVAVGGCFLAPSWQAPRSNSTER